MMQVPAIHRFWANLDILTVAGVLLTWIGIATAQPVPAGSMELVRMLEGRTPGKAVDCLNLRHVRSSRVVKGTAIIFEVGRTLYVNRPSGAELLSDSRTLVSRSFSPRLCRGEAVELQDLVARSSRGAILLGEFIPYRKAEHFHASPPADGYSGPRRPPNR